MAKNECGDWVVRWGVVQPDGRVLAFAESRTNRDDAEELYQHCLAHARCAWVELSFCRGDVPRALWDDQGRRYPHRIDRDGGTNAG